MLDKNKCRCESNELINKGIFNKWFIWNPNNCECDKVDKVVEECSENIEKNEMIYNVALNDYENVYGSCTIYTVLFFITFQ